MDVLRKIAALVRDPEVSFDATVFVLLLIVSVVVAFAVSLLYRIFYENRATGSQIHRSFFLLGPAITAIFIAIQFSLPLSLGLLGALSIIRFRTPIKEPEEVGFVMLLCACAVVTATRQLVLLTALLLSVTLALTVAKVFGGTRASKRKDGIVLVSYLNGGEGDQFAAVRQHVETHLPRSKLESLSMTEGLTTVQFSFCDLSADALDRLRSRLSDLDGLKSINLYFSNSSRL
ncbi:MAG: DUF4956 domain-containing protein [Chloroflexi bacterium]|nr:DUF4956 domain-containing protein [Chloroflexota bacterium]